ncbi:MAG: FAD:protein FMN transferase [Prevotella sp.]|nr:FAD:protein FMN transferase [Prevotella sp.]
MEENRRKQLRWQLPFLLLLIAGTVFVVRQQHDTPYRKCSGMIFGTVYNIAYQHADDLQKDIEAELATVDATFSMFNDQSIVSRLNRGEQDVQLTSMFTEVFSLANTISDDTGGAFDITVGPLVNAWGFGFKNEQMPSKAQVDSLLQLVGMRLLTLSSDARTLSKANPRVTLDFSAIAKGYGSDVVARLLRKKGIENFMVEIGGEVVTSGVNASRLPWRIGVTKPTEDSLSTGSQELQTVLNVTDRAMATSGNYRNFYYKGGRKYAHTIDPHTGYPVQHSILSATVLAPNCATADAYATSFMVMGMERAREVLDRHPELMAYFIYSDADGQLAVWFSPQLKGKILDE